MKVRLPLRGVVAGGFLGAGLGLYLVLPAAGSDRLSALAAGLLAAAGFLVGRRWMGLPVLSPALLYLGVFTLFHLGMAIPWALDAYDKSLPGWFVTSPLSPALSLVALATGCYLAGVLLAARPERGAFSPCPPDPALFWGGVAIYGAGWAMFFAGIRSFGGARFFDAGYAETYRLAAQFDPRLFGTSFTVTPIGLYLAAASFRQRRLAIVAVLLAVWAVGIFYLGFRGYALIPGLVTLALLRERGRRLPRWAGAALLSAVLAAIPAARAVRDLGVRQRSLEGMADRFHPLDGVVEMGGSLRPLVHTVTYMASEPWRWGSTYWQSVRTVVPNLAREWSGAPYIPLEELPPNHWLTAQAEPEMYRNYGGLGFSAVAEPYMNFGAPGVAVYFCGLGALLGRWSGRRWTDPARLAAAAMILGPLLWTVRNSFEIFFRPALWGVAAVGLLRAAGPALRPARALGRIRDACVDRL